MYNTNSKISNFYLLKYGIDSKTNNRKKGTIIKIDVSCYDKKDINQKKKIVVKNKRKTYKIIEIGNQKTQKKKKNRETHKIYMALNNNRNTLQFM